MSYSVAVAYPLQ